LQLISITIITVIIHTIVLIILSFFRVSIVTTNFCFEYGDANQKQDEGYRETKDIIGQVKARIPYMGWFTLWINDWRK